MASVLLLPDSAVLALVSVEVNEEEKMITATARTTSREVKCPICQQLAHRVQSKYVRTLADLPCSGQRIRWLVQIRRFWCQNSECPRTIFSERLPTCAATHARHTVQQAAVLCQVAFAAFGKAGEQIAKLLSMATSHDMLLRLMQRGVPPVVATPRILGLHDFAWKKGGCYGTLLIDQEAQESGIPELGSLAVGIYRDYDAVYGALETSYSNGQTEAQVHRLKLIKRQAHG